MSMLVCSVPLLSTLFSACSPPPPFATGYVAGGYALIAPVTAAQIDALHVTRGDRVMPGQPLAEMERRDAEIALKAAEAELARAESQLANLQQGKRPEEIGVIEAALASAKAKLAEAERTEQRVT